MERAKMDLRESGEVVNRIFEGDCLEYMDWIPDESVDMILCDLPYGMTQNEWDCYIPLDQLWEQYNRIIKPNGAIVLTSNGIFTAKLILSQPNRFKYKWVWEKSKPTNFLNAKKQPLRKHEDVCVFYKRQPTYHPQMTQGEPYDKGTRKNQLCGNYGDFEPVRVASEGERYRYYLCKDSRKRRGGSSPDAKADCPGKIYGTHLHQSWGCGFRQCLWKRIVSGCSFDGRKEFYWH